MNLTGEIVLSICKELQKDPNLIVKRPSIKNSLKEEVSLFKLVADLIYFKSIKEVAKQWGVTERVVARTTEILPCYGSGQRYKIYLLGLIGKKLCTKCDLIKDLVKYWNDKDSSDGKMSWCAECKYAHNIENYSEQINQISIARLRRLGKRLTIEEVEAVFTRDNHKCVFCGLSNQEHLLKFGTRLHLDHIIPVSKGGFHTIDNLQLACASCNSRKSNNVDLPTVPYTEEEKYINKLKNEKTKTDRRLYDWSLEFSNLIDLKDNKHMPFIAIANLYNTSDKTIAKWYKKAKCRIV